MNGKLWKSGTTCLSVHVLEQLYFPVSLFRPYFTLEVYVPLRGHRPMHIRIPVSSYPLQYSVLIK